VRLLIHAEIDRLVAKWHQDAAANRRLVDHSDDDTDLACSIAADTFEHCAAELQGLNHQIEQGTSHEMACRHDRNRPQPRAARASSNDNAR
jgi:hypothetical protein